MEKEFIPYEQALDLKQLGFNEKCLGGYVIYSDGEVKLSTNQIRLSNVEAPLYQQAFRWFREKHNLWVEIHSEDCVRLGQQKYYWTIFGEYKSSEVDSWIKCISDSNGILKDTYEEAEQECLNKLIAIVKDNMI